MDLFVDGDFIPVTEYEDDLVALPTDWLTIPKKSNLQFSATKDDSAVLLPITPWKNWREFECVYHNLFHHFYASNASTLNSDLSDDDIDLSQLHCKHDSVSNLQHSYDMIEMWRSRNFYSLPICVDVSQQLLHALYLFQGSPQSKRRTLAVSIARLVNRLTDTTENRTAKEWSERLRVPAEIVAIRHEIVHQSLPSLHSITQHAVFLLKWLNVRYWRWLMRSMDAECRQSIKAQLIAFKNQNQSKNKKKQSTGSDESDAEKLMVFFRKRLVHHLAVIEYFVPLFVDECLLQPKKQKKKNLSLPQLFEASFVQWNSLVKAMVMQHPCLLPYLVIFLVYKRQQLLHQHDNGSKHTTQTGLLLVWSASLLMDGDYAWVWKNNLDKERLVFVLNRVLKYVLPFNDELSKEMIINVKKKAQQFRVAQHMQHLSSIHSMQSFIAPLMRNVKSDECMPSLVADRMQASKCDAQLYEDAQQVQNTENQSEEDEDIENGGGNDEEDEDDDDDVNVTRSEKSICKWRTSNDCKFLPIGQSILPRFIH